MAGGFTKQFPCLPAESIGTWCSDEILVGRLQVKGFSLYHLLSGSETFFLASDHLCGCSLDAVMAEWEHYFIRHTAVLENKLENTSWGVIEEF